MFHCIVVSGSLAFRSDSSSCVTMSGLNLTVEVMRACNNGFDVKYVHVVSSVCSSQDEFHRIAQKSAETRTSPESISGFPDRQEGRIMSPCITTPSTAEPYPCKYDKEG